ncbi:hypothetical protein J5X84_06935 [Streptosporangiaceae bacterium NEAU-GS5]|nr:hypothetical protein [Streptosporangiaceae bacterium NEAU-GS5]
MHLKLARFGSLALVAPLVGATCLASASPAVAAPASVTTVKTTATKAEDPWSNFQVLTKWTKKVKKGGKIKYQIDIVNRGPEPADAYFIGGKLPKGIDLAHSSYVATKGTECTLYSDGFWCSLPYILEVDDVGSLDLTIKLKKGTKGTAVAKLGADSWNLPHGALELDRARWKELNVKHFYFLKTLKTKIR